MTLPPNTNSIRSKRRTKRGFIASRPARRVNKRLSQGIGNYTTQGGKMPIIGKKSKIFNLASSIESLIELRSQIIDDEVDKITKQNLREEIDKKLEILIPQIPNK